MTRKVYTGEDVDAWVAENDAYDADELFDEMLPKHRAKLDRLDKRISNLLAEIRKVFPEATYYTASGGFTLVLGDTHTGNGEEPQQQRSCWAGSATIGDGDW